MELSDGDLLAMMDIDEVGWCFQSFLRVMLACEIDGDDLDSDDFQKCSVTVAHALEQASLPESVGVVSRIDLDYLCGFFVRREIEKFGVKLDDDFCNIRNLIESGTESDRLTLSMICRNVILTFSKDPRVKGSELREIIELLATARTKEESVDIVKTQLMKKLL